MTLSHDLVDDARALVRHLPTSLTTLVRPEGQAMLVALQARPALVVTLRRQPVAAPRPVGAGGLAARLRAAEINLRALSAETALREVGIERGFRMEDLVLLRVSVAAAELADAERWWRRRLGPEPCIECLAIDVGDDDVDSGVDSGVDDVVAVFGSRGAAAHSQRQRYAPDPALDGRVRLEAFELHVTEHCNLRCAHCYNTSPYLDHKALAPADIAQTLKTMSGVIHADVFKIMGGEPLLHPEITEVVRVVRDSGIGDVVRLFTNGLLLHRMDDAFWRSLDHLTISSYDSAPVRPEHLALVEEKAQQFDVVLNVKPVDTFSQVMNNARQHDDSKVFETWKQCWLRHRCLVARDGRFFSCTRAAYLPDLHNKLVLTDPFDDTVARRDADSVAIDDPDLGDKVLALLNRDSPVNACRFCLGGDGPRERHRQLSRDDVRGGRLRPLPIVKAS